jgi:3-deoxy-D-manno-octulosonate 8-phosphate phosphatase (KDO 8-P phosphatase)
MAQKKKQQRKKISGASVVKALAKIKVLILDIDGVMTDGRIFYTEGAGWGAMYSVIDGFGIRTLMRNGVEVCFISGGGFLSHKKRAESLNIRHAYFGDENKIVAYEKIKADLGVADEDCAYVGDELFDIPVLERVAFAATPPHSPPPVKDAAHYVTKKAGGFGCVREITDLIMASRLKGNVKR